MTQAIAPFAADSATRPLLASDVVAPLGDAFVAEIKLHAMDWIPSRLAESGRIDVAQYGKRIVRGRAAAGRQAPTSPALMLAEAEQREKDAGVSGLPIYDGIRVDTLNIMIARAQERQKYEDIISRADKGLGTQIVLGATGFATDFADPVNLATMAIPIAGEAKLAYQLGKATVKLGPVASKLITRAGVGAYEGTVSAAALEPANYALHRKVGDDYTLADSLANVGLAAVGGGAFHAVGGAGTDFFHGMRARWGRSATEYGDAMDVALHQLGQGERVNLPPSTADAAAPSMQDVAGVRQTPDDTSLLASEASGGVSPAPTYAGRHLVEVIGTTIDASLDRLEKTDPRVLAKLRVGWGGGERAKTIVGRDVHDAFTGWVTENIPGWTAPKNRNGLSGDALRPDFDMGGGMQLELKPNTPTGRAKGRKQTAGYEENLGTKVEVIYYDFSKAQTKRLDALNERIRQLHTLYPEVAPKFVAPPKRKTKSDSGPKPKPKRRRRRKPKPDSQPGP